MSAPWASGSTSVEDFTGAGLGGAVGLAFFLVFQIVWHLLYLFA